MTIPKGKLIAISGNEDKGTHSNPKSREKYYRDFFELGILKRIVTELQVANPLVEVITTASMIPEEVGERYVGAFSILNCTNIGLMPIREATDADKPEYLERLRLAHGILFTGGDQSRLTDIFSNSAFLAICTSRYQNEADFVIAGTNAESLYKGAVKVGSVLGFIRNVIIDYHFVKRGRFGRLIEGLALYPKAIGIGLVKIRDY